jgi:prepilin peptidase CpaA
VAVTPYIVCAALYVTGLLLAALWDILTRSIPNVLVAAIAAAALALLLLGAPHTLLSHGIAALAVLGGGALLFALRLWGAGDAKLLAASTVLVGAQGLPVLILVTALAGGLMAAAWMAARRLPGRRRASARGLPYGVAIACGALVAFMQTSAFSALSRL